TGTHDNNTNRGWFDSLDDGTRDVVRRYLECDDSAVCYKMVRAALMCRSRWAICPMQDVLGLDGSARMNVPSTCGNSNWSWRMSREMLESRENMIGFTNNILLSGRA
ncbi:MAG: 4-alpha-glucanotransferase, partial [Spirochaetales bacterium]|nr:4-alpha-glucanotransferase [Spirochaetales bacterium]